MVRKEDVEGTLLAAFKRLKDGKPSNIDLKERARQGKRLVNITNVALEAGVSRTLIGFSGCRYDSLRAQILAYVDSNPRSGPSQALVDDLRAEIRRLRAQLELSDTYNAELLIELAGMKRSRDGQHPEDDTVRNFRQDRRRTRNSAADRAR